MTSVADGTASRRAFKALIKEIKDAVASSKPIIDQVRAIRLVLTSQLITCLQLAELIDLEAFAPAPRAHFQPRVEILVAGFGRTSDSRGFVHVISQLLPLEQQAFYRRIGRENAFDEVPSPRTDLNWHTVAMPAIAHVVGPGHSLLCLQPSCLAPMPARTALAPCEHPNHGSDYDG